MKEYSNAKETLLVISIFTMSIIMLGATGNFVVMTNNGGRMPVYSYQNFDSDSHFSFEEFSEVEHPFLADIIPISYRIFSIGDLFMFLGAVVFSPCIIAYVKIKSIEKYGKKN